MLIAKEDTYRSLSTFNAVEELNEAIRLHREHNTLNKTQLAVLDVLARYSCKYIGVSFATKTNIGAMIGKSRRTIIRVCNYLEECGIIRQHEVKRPTDMQQTSNAIVIQPFKRSVAQDEPNNVTPISSKPIKANTTLKDTASPANALKGALPKEVYEAMSRYFDADDIYKYYGILLRAKRSISRSVMVEDNPAPFVEALNACIFKHKRGKVNNFANYLYNAFQAATARAIRLLGRNKLAEDMAWLHASK